MANIIPIMSSSPPPLEEDEGPGWDSDDDFGTFTGAAPVIDHASDTGMARPKMCVPTPTVITPELRHPVGSLLDHIVSPPSIESENCIGGTELTDSSYLPHDHRHESIGIVTKGLELSQNVCSSGEFRNNSNDTSVPLTDSGVYSLNISPVQQCDYNSDTSHVCLEHSAFIQQSQICYSELSSTIVAVGHDSKYLNDQTTQTVAHSEKESFSMDDPNIGTFDSDNLVISRDGFNNIPEIDIPLGEHIEGESQTCIQQSQIVDDNAQSLSLDCNEPEQENHSNGFLFEGSSKCSDNLTEIFPVTNQEVHKNTVDRTKDCQLNVCISAQNNINDVNHSNENLKVLNTPCDSCVKTVHQPDTCNSMEEPCSTYVKCELFSDKPSTNEKENVYSKSDDFVIEAELSENGNMCNVATFNMSPCDKSTVHVDEDAVSTKTANDEVQSADNRTSFMEHSDDMQQVVDTCDDDLAELSESHANIEEIYTITVVKDECEMNEQIILTDISSLCECEFGNVGANTATSSEHDNDFKRDDSSQMVMNDFANFNSSVDDEIQDSDQSEDWAAFSDVNKSDKVSSECDIVDKRDELSPECDGWNAFSTHDKPDIALKENDTTKYDSKSETWAAFSGQQMVTDVITNNQDMEEWAGFEDEESSTSLETIPVQSSEERLSLSEFQNMSKQEKLGYAVMMCFPHLMTSTETMEDKFTTVPEANYSDTIVWDHVTGQNTTEALLYQWTKSEWNAQLFSTLHIDTRNILIGHKRAPVPVFASSLGILEPTKGPAHPLKPDVIAERTTSNSSLKAHSHESIPVAQFDWSGSGLTNPLEANNKTLNLDFLIQDQVVKSSVLEAEFLENKVSPVHESTLQPLENILVNLKTKSSTFRVTNQSEQMSIESKNVIQSLPDLSFMMSRVLMFPLKTDS